MKLIYFLWMNLTNKFPSIPSAVRSFGTVKKIDFSLSAIIQEGQYPASLSEISRNVPHSTDNKYVKSHDSVPTKLAELYISSITVELLREKRKKEKKQIRKEPAFLSPEKGEKKPRELSECLQD